MEDDKKLNLLIRQREEWQKVFIQPCTGQIPGQDARSLALGVGRKQGKELRKIGVTAIFLPGTYMETIVKEIHRFTGDQ